MTGLLADINVQRHMEYQLDAPIALRIRQVLEEIGISFATFRDLGLPPDLDDRSPWGVCQRESYVLFTEDRNDDGPDSLERTLADSWEEGCLPVLTLASKGRFTRDRDYQERTAASIAELLFGIKEIGEFRDQPRVYAPHR